MGDLVAARRLGVYYTPDDIALGLTRWALAGGATRVLDPSCGDGRFIRAAATLLADAAGPDVVGIDVDEAAVRALRAQYVRGVRLDARSFFDLPPVACQGAPFGAVVGNPPYVRHHWQDSAVLESARNRAAEAGVTLSGLADLWAYFVIHATQHVALDGRLSLVLPVAATQAEYAQDVWNFVQHNFSHVELLVLQDRAFEHAREQPVVLLASGRRGATWDRNRCQRPVYPPRRRPSTRRAGGCAPACGYQQPRPEDRGVADGRRPRNRRATRWRPTAGNRPGLQAFGSSARHSRRSRDRGCP
jgi:adenine-specific DNA-methyltransferase